VIHNYPNINKHDVADAGGTSRSLFGTNAILSTRR
jgi:hypothetical protein